MKIELEWIRIDREKDEIPKSPFWLSDDGENVWVGFTSFDYLDDEAKYWFPQPRYPQAAPIITNDACIPGLLDNI